MARKEQTTKVFRGYKTILYDNSTKRRVEAIGNTKEESIERAYKRWREKYGEV